RRTHKLRIGGCVVDIAQWRTVGCHSQCEAAAPGLFDLRPYFRYGILTAIGTVFFCLLTEPVGYHTSTSEDLTARTDSMQTR
ncbi:hypothetical protein AK37_00215, partial [Rhodococcus pyridinivorans AK37]